MGPTVLPDWLDPIFHGPWLSAPMGGYPLYRRLLESLLPLRPSMLAIEPGLGVHAFEALMHSGPQLGLRTISVDRFLNEPFARDEGFAIHTFTGLDSAITTRMIVEHQQQLRTPALLARSGVSSSLLLQAGTITDPRAILDHVLGDVSDWEAQWPDASVSNLGAPMQTGSATQLKATARNYLDLLSAARILNGTPLKGVLISPRAKVHRKATLTGPVAIGEGSFVSRHAVLHEGAIIGENCFIGAGAIIEDAVVLSGTRIEPGFHLKEGVRIGEQVFPGRRYHSGFRSTTKSASQKTSHTRAIDAEKP
jgi:hypothetical protein